MKMLGQYNNGSKGRWTMPKKNVGEICTYKTMAKSSVEL